MLSTVAPAYIGTVTRNPNVARMIAACTNQPVTDLYPFCKVGDRSATAMDSIYSGAITAQFSDKGGVPRSDTPFLHINRYPENGLCGNLTPTSNIHPLVDNLFNTAALSTGILLVARCAPEGERQ